MMALSLCLMSVIGFANNRQVTALLPNNMPSVSMTNSTSRTKPSTAPCVSSSGQKSLRKWQTSNHYIKNHGKH